MARHRRPDGADEGSRPGDTLLDGEPLIPPAPAPGPSASARPAAPPPAARPPGRNASGRPSIRGGKPAEQNPYFSQEAARSSWPHAGPLWEGDPGDLYARPALPPAEGPPADTHPASDGLTRADVNPRLAGLAGPAATGQRPAFTGPVAVPEHPASDGLAGADLDRRPAGPTATGERPAFTGPVEPAEGEGAAPKARLSGGIILFWVGMLAISGSTFVVLALLSHRGKPGELAAISVVFALTFITQMLPAAIQLRAAALVATRQRVPRAPRRVVLIPTLVLLAFAPIAPRLIHAPALAVAAVGLTFPPSLWLARSRGALIGQKRFGETGASCGVEACWRLGAGSALGWTWGATGVAAGILVAVLVSLATTPPHRPQRGGNRNAQVGSLTESLLSVGVLIALVQLDVLIAPAVLSPAGADRFAAAALPAKGIFLALMAAGWFAVPDASKVVGRFAILKPAVQVTLAGLGCAVVVIVAFPLVSAILGSTGATRGLGAPLAVAMAVAVGTRVEVNLAVARGQSKPWLSLVPSIVLLGSVAAMHPGTSELALGVLVAHVLAFVVCGVRLMLTPPMPGVAPATPAGSDRELARSTA